MTRNSLLFFFILVCGQMFAQDVGDRQLIDVFVFKYLQMVGDQSALYYGNEQDKHLRASNHPYLKEELYVKARLSYCRIIYPEVLLRLDLSRDELVVQAPDRRNIVLFPENVDFAELYNQQIIYFRTDSLPGCPSSGYYILLHSGNCKVLEKKTATLMLENNSRNLSYTFSTRFYLYQDGIYYNIRTKNGLLKVLYPHKKELKRFISANHLRFRRDAEEFLSLTIGEYEKISGTQ